jgi:hypothetical protein
MIPLSRAEVSSRGRVTVVSFPSFKLRRTPVLTICAALFEEQHFRHCRVRIDVDRMHESAMQAGHAVHQGMPDDDCGSAEMAQHLLHIARAGFRVALFTSFEIAAVPGDPCRAEHCVECGRRLGLAAPIASHCIVEDIDAQSRRGDLQLSLPCLRWARFSQNQVADQLPAALTRTTGPSRKPGMTGSSPVPP